jgi:hypothetical protein
MLALGIIAASGIAALTEAGGTSTTAH